MPEKNLSKKKKNKSEIKELLQTEKGKSLLFFGFYFIFFLVVILLVRTSHSESTNKDIKKELKVNYTYHLDFVKEENYHYKYLTTVADDIFLYEGDKEGQKELFSVTGEGLTTDYYRDGELFIKQTDGIWNMAENPYLLSSFYDSSLIEKILQKAKFIAKTQYESGESELKFTITTEELLALTKEQALIQVQGSNEIIVKLDSSKNVVGLEYDLTNYETNILQKQVLAKIEITYSNFGKIKNLTRP